MKGSTVYRYKYKLAIKEFKDSKTPARKCLVPSTTISVAFET